MRRSLFVCLLFIVGTLGTNTFKPSVMRAQIVGPSDQQSTIQQSPGLDSPDQLKLRQDAYLRQHLDSSGQTRPDLWERGIANVVAGKALGPITGTQWAQVGPAPLRIDMEQIFQGAGPDSGEVVDVAIDPSGVTDQILYIATNDGGVWKSVNAGATWTPKTDSMPSLSMGAVALDPANASVVYAGTGNPFDGGGVFSKGIGIYKSVNGGNTWTILNPGSIFTDRLINRIVLPASDVLLVATNFGLYKSVDGGANFGANAPLFNNGLPVLAGSGFISDLDLDTATSTKVYASVSGSGIFQSTDSGSTFPINLFNNAGAPSPPFGFVALTQSTQGNNQTMYASVQGFPFAGLFKSTNAGGSWAVQPGAAFTGAANGGCQCGYDQTVGVDPQNSNRVYIGFQELYLSTDGAVSFGATPATRNKVHWDHHALIFSPQLHWGAAPTRVYVGTDGGLATSGDGGGNWSNINETIATNLYTFIAIGRGSAANRGYTFGGAQDTGTTEHQPGFPGADWHLGIDGDGAGVAVDPTNPMRAYGADNGAYIVTNNGGNSWSFNPPVGLTNGAWRLAVDPNNGNNIFVGSATNGFVPGPKLYRSTNFGVSYQPINTFPANIQAIANVTSNSNVLWVGLTDGTVQLTTNALDATPIWTSRTVAGAPFGQPVAGVAIDPTNTSTVVVVYPGFSGISQTNRTKHVFITTDNGLTWNDISGTDGGFVFNNLPDLPLHAVVIDPNTTPHGIIVAGDSGVMRSIDLGTTWHALGTDLPITDCTSLAIDPGATPGLLRVGTYGRSVFELAPGACTLTCTNITKSTDPGQCGAIVTFAPTTSGTCGTVTCTPPSGSFFPKGTTTVICLSAGPSCSFTITVNDTEKPIITCPADINVAAAASCPIATSTPVTFTVTATDNCPGVTFVCKNQNNQVVTSGQSFPVGTTTVTCTATDTSGNMSTCSFTITVFSACLVDESNGGNVVLFNAQTGEYRFCCNGALLATGKGVLTIRACIGTIDELKGSRKVHIEFDTSANNGKGKGTAALFLDGSTNPKCKITDMSMAGNVCGC